MSIRVVVADDQDLVRTGLVMILSAQPGIDVIGEAADGIQALEVATRAVEDARAAQAAERRAAEETEDARITALATAMVAEITAPMRARASIAMLFTRGFPLPRASTSTGTAAGPTLANASRAAW